MRVHLLAVPNTQTTAAYFLDGFCQRTILFAELLKRLGHEVILYGAEENDAPCDAFVSCISKAEQAALIGDTPYQCVSWEHHTPIATTFNARAAAHIRTIKQPRDIIATIAGTGQTYVADAHPELLFLEYSVGYQGVSPKSHRVYQSYAWQHIVYGFSGMTGARAYDAVIPPWFHVEHFPSVTRPDPYVVYCGRIVRNKGITMVCDAAKHAGVKLLVMGHGDPSLVTYGEYLGAVPTDERNTVLSRAQACLMPTLYVEPFGNVSAEAQLCGTPVIGPTFGAFTESIEQGVTGFRCDSLGDYVQAIRWASRLDRLEIRARAVDLYGEPTARDAYRRYFARLDQLQRGDGVGCLTSTLADEDVYGFDESLPRAVGESQSAVGHLDRYDRSEPVPAAAVA